MNSSEDQKRNVRGELSRLKVSEAQRWQVLVFLSELRQQLDDLDQLLLHKQQALLDLNQLSVVW